MQVKILIICLKYYKREWIQFNNTSFALVFLHVPDQLPHLLHHLLLGHGCSDAQVDGVWLPLLTRLTRLLKSLKVFMEKWKDKSYDNSVKL